MSAAPVVLFDLDDTLMAHREAVSAGIIAHMRRRAYSGDDEHAARLWHELEERHYHSYLAGELSFEGQRRARARDFAAAHGETLDDPASGAWFDEYFDRYRASWALHGDALPALDAIARELPGVAFGIITNGEPDFQARKLAQLGIADRFAHVVASGEVGVTKPDPGIFALAVERFGTEPSRALYVGDRLATDALGAARAGLAGVWLDRLDATPAPEELAEIDRLGVDRIASLAELPELVVRRLGG